MTKVLFLSLLGITLLGLKASAQPAGESKSGAPATQNTLTSTPAVYVQQAPPLDGTVTAPAWHDAKWMNLAGVQDQAAPLATKAAILMDANNLYIAWNCADPKTDALVSNSTELWQDDSVEAFVSPDGKNYYHFTVNCKGSLGAAKGAEGDTEDTAWKSTATVKASIDKNVGWTVTLCIPLKDLSAKSGKAQTWDLNLNRTKPSGGDPPTYVEYSWSNKGAHKYNDMSTWGKLTGVDVP